MSNPATILVVEDVLRSRELYEKIMGLKVESDFGIYNVGFEGGLGLYQKKLFQDLTGGLPVSPRSNSYVIYFEVNDLDGLESVIAQNGFEFIHRIKVQPWQQRIFRFYDYDGHINEVAEHMHAVIHRLSREGNSSEKIAEMISYSLEKVNEILAQPAR